ncbi:hypothetical protein HY734_00235 [Candidatus Uhrbacteria bacterium]|nr:hypothetical protein [Candidatus Uhrbacteria bacterium]
MILEDEMKRLVIARLETLPDGTGISIGPVQELIRHVKQGDTIGRTIIEAEMQFLQALKTGVFYGTARAGD